MNVREIQKAIMRDDYRIHFTLPNYTPRKWFECDVFVITKAGYMREYEIKISRSDFRSYAKKLKTIWNWNELTGKGDNQQNRKHDQLNQASTDGPRQFWYVTPENMVTAEEVPTWAGLIYALQWKESSRVACWQVKAAPILHSQKVSAEVRQHAEGICYWRFMNAFMKHSFEP